MKVVLDNLKAGVIEASLTDPILNSSYKELAHHYGFIISPCAPLPLSTKEVWKMTSNM